MKPHMLDSAVALLESIDNGKGWDAASKWCTPAAKFQSDAFPDIHTIEAYAGWMKGLVDDIAPDGKYTILSTTWNDNQVTFVAKFEGTHTLPGGPVPPSDPPKHMSTDYVYTFTFNDEGKCISMYKVWDVLTAKKGWGWPL